MTPKPPYAESAMGVLIDPATLRFERLLLAPVERVWAMLVEPEQRARWLCGGVWELKPGGRAEFAFHNRSLTTPDDPAPAEFAGEDGPVSFLGEVLQVEPPHLIELSMIESDGRRTRMRFELQAERLDDQDVTRLIATQFDLTAPEDFAGIGAGWHTHLDIMTALADGAPRPPFWAHFSALKERYAALAR